MKRVAIVLCSVVALWGSDLKEVIEALETNRLVQTRAYEAKAREHLYRAAKGANLPSLDADLNAVWLREQPTITLELPSMPRMKVPMGKKRTFRFEAAISYPLFTGFSITNMIEKSRYEAMASRLKKRDLKRNLSSQAVGLYAGLYASGQQLKALKAAKKALELSYKKAKGFYDQGLVPRSDLYNIEAKRFEVEAAIEETKAQRRDLQNSFRYLVGFVPDRIRFKKFELPGKLDFRKRADIEALRKELLGAKSDIGIAKSRFYPQIGLKAAFRRFGDTLALDGDGVRNADESYIGAGINYNLYSGGSDKERVEAAKAAWMAKRSYLSDYIHKVKTDIDNAYNTLRALQKRYEWAKKELAAKREYRALTQGRYENQLASADELSRAIADEAAAEARMKGLRAQIFAQKCKILLLHSFDDFKRRAL